VLFMWFIVMAGLVCLLLLLCIIIPSTKSRMQPFNRGLSIELMHEDIDGAGFFSFIF